MRRRLLSLFQSALWIIVGSATTAVSEKHALESYENDFAEAAERLHFDDLEHATQRNFNGTSFALYQSSRSWLAMSFGFDFMIGITIAIIFASRWLPQSAIRFANAHTDAVQWSLLCFVGASVGTAMALFVPKRRTLSSSMLLMILSASGIAMLIDKGLGQLGQAFGMFAIGACAFVAAHIVKLAERPFRRKRT